MLEELTGLFSASTPSLLKTAAVQHVVSIVLATTDYYQILVLFQGVDMVFRIVLYSVEKHSSTSTQQRQTKQTAS